MGPLFGRTVGGVDGWNPLYCYSLWVGLMCQHFLHIGSGCNILDSMRYWSACFLFAVTVVVVDVGVDSTGCAGVGMNIAPHLIVIHFANHHYELFAWSHSSSLSCRVP